MDQLLSESGTQSAMRAMCFIALLTAVVIAIGGGLIVLLMGKDATIVLSLVGIFSSLAFGGKVGQKALEVKNVNSNSASN